MQRNKRLRERTWAYVEDDVTSVVEETISLCGGGVPAADVAAAAAQLATRAASLGDELSSRNTDDETRDTVRAAQRRVTLCHTAARRCLQRRSDAAALRPSSVDAATQTAAAAAASATGAAAAASAKRARLDDAVFTPEPAPSPVASPVVAPSSPAAPPVFQAPPPPAVVTSALSLSEGDMVRIAADLVFAIMRAAQASSYQIRSLGELFIECDKNGDGGISFVELLQWVKNDLKVAVTDWQLDEFGKHMGWREICKAHPLGHIDQKGFYAVVRSVWRKVKWYFSNAVVYGVSKRDTQKRRHAEVLNIMDELRDPLQRLIQQLVVKGCHIHQFFASFDAERTQQISTEALAKVFAGLGIVAAEHADDLSLKVCLVANYLTSGFPTEHNGGGGEFARQDTLDQLQKENGQTFHYAAMCELGKQGQQANVTMGMADADCSLGAFGAQPSFVMIDEETSCESTDVMMDNTVTEGIARTIRSLGITLVQLQDLVLEFFSEFTLRMDLNVLAEESRDKLIFRHLYFAVCGVFEAQTELQPVANIFTLFAKYAERDTGLLHPYGFQQLLKRELCISVTEHEVVSLHSLLSHAGRASLSLDEFAGLLKVASDEATKLMCRKLPQGFAQQQQQHQRRCLSKEAAHALAKLILRVLQGEATTFDGFFRGLPQLRPSDSSFSAASKDGPRYPDELAVGMRRVGVLVEPTVFETLAQAQAPDGGGGGGGGAMRWEPRPSFLTKDAFLGLVWHVFVVHVQPAFAVAATWQEEATRLAGRMRAAMYQFVSKKTALGVPARDQVAVMWDALPKDAAGQVPVPAFVNAAVVSCAEMYDGLDDERTLVDPAEAKTVWQEGRPVEACVRQVLHLASVSGSVTQEQAGRIFLS